MDSKPASHRMPLSKTDTNARKAALLALVNKRREKAGKQQAENVVISGSKDVYEADSDEDGPEESSQGSQSSEVSRDDATEDTGGSNLLVKGMTSLTLDKKTTRSPNSSGSAAAAPATSKKAVSRGESEEFSGFKSASQSFDGSKRQDDEEVESDYSEVDSVPAEHQSSSADLILGDGKFVVPGRIARGLYDHQREGIEWMWGLHEIKRGGILGDDMGLGKTRQIATFIAGLMAAKLASQFLLVVPATLLPQWKLEFSSVGISNCKEFTSSISVRERPYFLEAFLERGGVMLTTYEMVQNIPPQSVTWDYLVLDEGHLAKNPSTKRFQVLKALRFHHSIIMTGTPIQNELKITKSTFRAQYEKRILDGSQSNSTGHQKRCANEASAALREKIRPHFLRRMKKEIFPSLLGKDEPTVKGHGPSLPRLPQKHDLIVWLKLTNRQSHMYETFLMSDAVRSVLNKTSSPLSAITVLKKICDHPGLLSEAALEEVKDSIERESTETGASISTSIQQFLEDPSIMADPGASCKIRMLKELVVSLVNDGHRVLVFSQTKMLLNMAESTVRKLRIGYVRIDGDTKPDMRERRVQEFQLGEIPVFMLTTKVGGLGLTLHAADCVIIMDPAWNPSVDNQSVDRAYRLGQARDVVVYRLITAGTVEEKIYRKQVFKDGLMRSATSDKNNLRYFSHSELADMFRMPDNGFGFSETQQKMEDLHKDQIVLKKDMVHHLDFIKKQKVVVGVSHHDLLFSTEEPELLGGAGNATAPDAVAIPRRPSGNVSSARGTKQHVAPGGGQWRGGTGQAPGGILAAAGAVVPDSYQLNREAEQHRMAQAHVVNLSEKLERQKKMLNNPNITLKDGGENLRRHIEELTEELERAKAHADKLKLMHSSPLNGSQAGLASDVEADKEQLASELTNLGL
ncbi:hypothetical protein CLOM_g21804 [Closterium sp. NIES-68]|nr:hypothetical protein CLOM_g21804 [Closterium sp. NIES-68]GJP77232.1 hypothetical protein CLOP_g7664 [Closterium sp. NIES-67]